MMGGDMAIAPRFAAFVAFAACVLLCAGAASHALAQPDAAQDAPVYEFYEHYDVGYDTSYDDDWFFDYYAYSPAAPEPTYDYYTDYDYEADRFDWEQPGALP
jgi:hypothetical protein